MVGSVQAQDGRRRVLLAVCIGRSRQIDLSRVRLVLAAARMVRTNSFLPCRCCCLCWGISGIPVGLRKPCCTTAVCVSSWVWLNIGWIVVSVWVSHLIRGKKPNLRICSWSLCVALPNCWWGITAVGGLIRGAFGWACPVADGFDAAMAGRTAQQQARLRCSGSNGDLLFCNTSPCCVSRWALQWLVRLARTIHE